MAENLTREEVLDYQEQATLFAPLINTWDGEMIRRYLDQTRGQVDGTMDVILPHYMSITEMRKAQHNMRFLRSMAEYILAVQKLAREFLQSEAA
jgi:hypothetical protein